MVSAVPGGVDPLKRLALYCYSAGEHAGALEALGRLKSLVPEDLEVIENIGVILRLGGRTEEAVENLLEVHRLDPARVNVCDALAHCYASLGRDVEMQRFGRCSLELKDGEAAKRDPLRVVPETAPPPFVPGERNRHVISFSLWGANPRYLQGALRNSIAVIDVYPDWICRFYCDDSVPPAILNQIRGNGAEVVMRPRPEVFYEGLLWRFEVINDPGISHFLVRDCDSVVNVKERVAVDEWLQSGKWFHSMRDFASHTEVILAGMWGGVAGVLPAVEELRSEFKPLTAPTRTFDQHLLRDCVWPIVRQSVLIHDSVYTGCLGSVPFSLFGGLPPKNHIGQNEAAVRPLTIQNTGAALPDKHSFGSHQSSLFVLTGMNEEAVLHLGRLVGRKGNVHCYLETGISDIREKAGRYAADLFAPESDRNQTDALAEKILKDSLGGLVGECGGKPVGFVELRESIESLLPLAVDFDLKILCVIRDLRDIASSQRLTATEDCELLADTWIDQLKAIGTASRNHPGLLEIVRYEDLAENRCAGTLARISRFLGIGAIADQGLVPVPIDSLKPLPKELLSVIETRAASFLAKLQYPARGSSDFQTSLPS